MDPRKDFTLDEANRLIGKDIRTNVKFSGIPIGTTGRIMGKYAFNGGFHLDIMWRVPDRIVDGFSKDEFTKFLEVL